MKEKTKIITALVIAAGLILVFALSSGCAQIGPAMVSPGVYKSSNKAMVAGNQAREAQLLSEKNDTELERARANEWNQVALNEIKGKATGGGKNQVITKDGVLGGFLCLFINDSWMNKKLTIQKKGGFLNGKKWPFNLTSHGGFKEYKLPAGRYSCWWTIEYSDQIYPVSGPAEFVVTVDPHIYDEERNENYHGGYRLFGGY